MESKERYEHLAAEKFQLSGPDSVALLADRIHSVVLAGGTRVDVVRMLRESIRLAGQQ